MSDTEYMMVMLAKLIDALIRKGTEQDGNWGYPTFHQELLEMSNSLHEQEAVKKATKIFTQI